jgi:UDP-glucuronate 4-epimerase
MKILITGGAGFIGSACAKALMDRGDKVVIVDNFNDYYNPQIKRDRLSMLLKGYKNKCGESKKGCYTLYKADIRNVKKMDKIFAAEKIDKVIHLAAMAGVRASLEDPLLYADVNVMGTTNLLNLSVKYKIKNFVYASSSSVYGGNTKTPFSEKDPVEKPVSPYAATKKATELLAHTFSHLYNLPTTGLRFFTVYGPWGRPDMGVFKFPDLIMQGKTIEIYNGGDMERNFTYIDDIVSGTITVLDADLPCDVMNIGGDRTVQLMDFIEETEKAVGKKAKKKFLPMQPGDVQKTSANIRKLRALGWKPTTRITDGIPAFVTWYKEYYNK